MQRGLDVRRSGRSAEAIPADSGPGGYVRSALEGSKANAGAAEAQLHLAIDDDEAKDLERRTRGAREELLDRRART